MEEILALHFSVNMVFFHHLFVCVSLFVISAIRGECHQQSELQMPFGYYKYPYQAVYPGDGEG
jgi:hypothetical protein